ncbi:hypothetical protein GOBAR_AA01022 [Gossypium barbadense]|uniref:Uncharacterized protein n=1 Tax=Gossypium barbadense TaxID=3634 RepID=A0A2P5YVH0_GOSBA|nr:hypothetical protein GOBAR_AA01022 [Gossypium barbadense]
MLTFKSRVGVVASCPHTRFGQTDSGPELLSVACAPAQRPRDTSSVIDTEQNGANLLCPVQILAHLVLPDKYKYSSCHYASYVDKTRYPMPYVPTMSIVVHPCADLRAGTLEVKLYRLCRHTARRIRNPIHSGVPTRCARLTTGRHSTLFKKI